MCTPFPFRAVKILLRFQCSAVPHLDELCKNGNFLPLRLPPHPAAVAGEAEVASSVLATVGELAAVAGPALRPHMAGAVFCSVQMPTAGATGPAPSFRHTF